MKSLLHFFHMVFGVPRKGLYAFASGCLSIGQAHLWSLPVLAGKSFFSVRRTERKAGGERWKGIEINSEHFPDSVFREYVRLLAQDGEVLTPADMATVTVLDVSGRGISDLSGMECFSELECLYCQRNRLTDLNVGCFEKLRELDCSDNSLTSLQLGSAASLKYLYCFGNGLLELNVSGCPQLRYLYCEKNRLEALDLSGNPKLEELSCFQNHLETLDVSRNLYLTELFCFSNRLCALDVSACAFLRAVDCADNCRKIKLGKDRTLRLSELAGLEPEKADAWRGGGVSDGVLTVHEGQAQVTYRYHIAPDRCELFFLRFC